MPQYILYKANTRGRADHGWLQTFHSFSFANYYDRQRMNFGALRVINDDTIAGGMGFGMHPHDNMEIITIPLEGDLEHKDSMGNTSVIKNGDVQVMSAGSGVQHSEFNHSKTKQVKLLQIWVIPNKRMVTPRYEQMTLDSDFHNNLKVIVAPKQGKGNVWIHQDAWFSIGRLDKDFKTEYIMKAKGDGVYAFVISGDITIDTYPLHSRDGLGISETEKFSIKADSDCEILLMEVPM